MAERDVVCCIGAGRMGRGIAYVGHKIHLLDAKPRDSEAFEAFRTETLDVINGSLSSLARLRLLELSDVPTILKRVKIHSLEDAEVAFVDAKIVFEGVPDALDAKQQAFALFDQHADEDAILASTTSTILSTDLAEFTKSPECFLNAHWLNPAFVVPLVEVSPTPKTATNIITKLNEFLESIGKVPVLCKASPGYIAPRIQALAMNDERFAAPDIIKSNMENDRIGLRTGQGFYNYDNVDVAEYQQQIMAAYLKILQNNDMVCEPVLLQN
ncbi:MAG: 3-hydroxyacyl-CoA dehydrogenase NAD-binding domain-containing protein [Rhizobiaceae bacterium]